MLQQRATLIEKLETVAPALADNDLVPLFTHFIFTGNKLMAHCERLAISVPLKTEFKAAVPGKFMLGMLRAAIYKDIELEVAGNGLRIKAVTREKNKDKERTLITLPVLSTEQQFSMPQPAAAERNLPSEPDKFFTAIDNCLQSVAPYSTRPDELGITVIGSSGQAALYSTNNNTLSYAKVKLRNKSGFRIILSAEFCRQMLRLRKEAKSVALELRDGYAMFTAGNVQLYGTLLQSRNPVDYEKVMARVRVEHSDKTLCSKPAELEHVLNRAALITDIAGRDISTRITLNQGRAKFESESERGKVVDEIAVRHPNIEVRTQPALWRAGYDRYEKFKITNQAVVMTHPDGLFAVAVKNS